MRNEAKEIFFKSELLRLLTEACEARISSEDPSLPSSWKDWGGEATIGTIIIVSTSVIALLASSTVSIGTSIPIGIAGIGIGIAYHQYRNKKKKDECARIAELFQNRDLKTDVNNITETLLSLYKNAIITLTPKDIQKVTAALSKILLYIMMKGKINDIEDLLNAPALYYLLIQHGQKIAKVHIETENIDHFKRNIRGLITKAGIYDQEAEKIYVHVNEKEKPTKYGVVCFRTAQDFKEYEQRFKKNQYQALPTHETTKLLAHSIFKTTLPVATPIPKDLSGYTYISSV